MRQRVRYYMARTGPFIISNIVGGVVGTVIGVVLEERVQHKFEGLGVSLTDGQAAVGYIAIALLAGMPIGLTLLKWMDGKDNSRGAFEVLPPRE
jgi:fructose-specific phosphotransferase system IIC component